jgi:hypothetical protein
LRVRFGRRCPGAAWFFQLRVRESLHASYVLLHEDECPGITSAARALENIVTIMGAAGQLNYPQRAGSLGFNNNSFITEW